MADKRKVQSPFKDRQGGLGGLGGMVTSPFAGDDLLMMAAANAGPQMQSYEPSWRERLGNMVFDYTGGMGGLGGIPNRMRNEAMIGMDFIPGVGEALGADDTARAFNAGNYLDAAVSGGATALGTLPIGGDIAGGVLKAIFGGVGAKTADKFMLERAQDLAARGADRSAIWSETGWFQGPDGQWRFEIDDSGSQYNRDEMQTKIYNIGGNIVPSREGTAGAVLSHPGLFDAYPEMAGMTVGQTNYGAGSLAQYHEGGSYTPEMIGLERSVILGDARPHMLHELQHAVQQREDFARGGSAKSIGSDVPNPRVPIYERALVEETALPEMQRLAASPEYANELDQSNALWTEVYGPRMDAIEAQQTTRGDYARLQPMIDALFEEFKAVAKSKFPTMTKVEELQELLKRKGIPLHKPNPTLSPDDAYRSLAGETEARNVQSRMNMTPEQRRATPPWATQDVPDELQIVRRR